MWHVIAVASLDLTIRCQPCTEEFVLIAAAETDDDADGALLCTQLPLLP